MAQTDACFALITGKNNFQLKLKETHAGSIRKTRGRGQDAPGAETPTCGRMHLGAETPTSDPRRPCNPDMLPTSPVTVLSPAVSQASLRSQAGLAADGDMDQ